MKKKRTAAETWKVLEAQADAEEVARVHALDDVELDREMQALGLDPKVERAKAEALQRALVARMGASRGKAPAEQAQGKGAQDDDERASLIDAGVTIPQRAAARTRPASRWFAPVAGAAAVAAVGVAVATGVGGIGPKETDAGVEVMNLRPEEMRREAFSACGKKEWDACEAWLDRAAALDPKGEGDPQVQAARRAIAAAAALPDKATPDKATPDKAPEDQPPPPPPPQGGKMMPR